MKSYYYEDVLGKGLSQKLRDLVLLPVNEASFPITHSSCQQAPCFYSLPEEKEFERKFYSIRFYFEEGIEKILNHATDLSPNLQLEDDLAKVMMSTVESCLKKVLKGEGMYSKILPTQDPGAVEAANYVLINLRCFLSSQINDKQRVPAFMWCVQVEHYGNKDAEGNTHKVADVEVHYGYKVI